VEAQLRRLDDGLRIRWNPAARFARSSYIDVLGQVIHNDRHEGRWQVGKESLDATDPERFVVIYTLESEEEQDFGAYRAVGDWLIGFFRKWDAANANFRAEWEKEWAGHDALLKKGEVWQDLGAAEEGLDRMYHKMTERHTRYPGRGADFNVRTQGTDS
jgi:hypothetical protein